MADLLTSAPGCVLVDAHGGPSSAQLLHDAARIAAALPPPTPGSHIAMAFGRDRAAFLATLLAVWAKGHAAALPIDARRNSLVPVLARPEVALLAHDTGVGMGLDVPKLLASAPLHALLRANDLPLVGALTYHAATAMGTLATRVWSKAQLADLLARTSAQLALPAGVTVWNALPPGSPCALVAGLLAPLGQGCRIAGGPLADPGEAAAHFTTRSVHTLVAPAALLRVLARRHLPALTTLVQVVAADEPLDECTIALFAAHRIGTVTLPDAVRVGTPDARATALLHRVFAQDGIDDAAAEMVFGSDGLHLCCAIATTEHREQDLRRDVPIDAATTTLRIVPSLLRDDDGRLPRSVLLRLFDRNSDGILETTQIDRQEVPGADGTRTFRVLVPTNFFAFAGHFPTYPVLSGALQLHELVLPCLRRVLDAPFEVAGFQDLKFLARIGPGDTVLVTLRSDLLRKTAEFEITRAGTKCSSGRVTLRGAGRGPVP